MGVDDFDFKRFGKRLSASRERAGWSQDGLASELHYSQQYISKLELGKNTPSTLALLATWARRCRTSADYLLCLTDIEGPPAGEPWTAYGREIVAVLEKLPEERRAELVRIGEVMVDAERQRANESADMERKAQLLEDHLSPAKYRALMEILETSVRTGDADTAGRKITLLLRGC